MKTNPSIDKIISYFNMNPHIEGGFSCLFYEDSEIIQQKFLLKEFADTRSYCNGIYFLIPKGINTTLHSLPMNEIWHFCLGDPVKLYEIDPNGQISMTILGSDFGAGHKCLHIVKKGNWFGSSSTGNYSLVTCITSPGFKEQDYIEANRK